MRCAQPDTMQAPWRCTEGIREYRARSGGEPPSGRLDDTERGYHSFLAVQPDDSDGLHLLGVTLCQKGRKLEVFRWIDRRGRS